MIVTIDGPAGSGKSTAARGLAQRLKFHFLDTGAMYRAVAWACLKQQVDYLDAQKAAKVACDITISFEGERVFVDKNEVTEAIRDSEVTQSASVFAMIPEVRRELVQQQRRVADGLNIVSEGRDQGTIAFPHAECKFFLTADANERANRRRLEQLDKGVDIPIDELLEQIKARDKRDENRAVSPLVAAEDAMQIDTSKLDAAGVLDLLERTVRERMAQSQGAG